MHCTDAADDLCFLTKVLMVDFWLAVSRVCFAFQPVTTLENEVLLGEAEATCACVAGALETNLPPELFKKLAQAAGREKQDMVEYMSGLPVEDLLNQAITLMASIEAVVSSEGTRRAPDEALALIGDIRALVGGADTQAIPGEVRAGLAELRGVVEELRLRGAIDRLASVLESADTIAANTASASGEFPALVAQMQALVARAQGVEIEELAAETEMELGQIDWRAGSSEGIAASSASE
jgi:hypothetical protein